MPKFKTPKEAALLLAEKGFKLFPLKPNSKVPAVRNWKAWANDKHNVRQIESYDSKHNWGISCGESNITVIDIDNKHGVSGLDNLKALNLEIPKTLTVKTPSGGYHLYYAGEFATSTGRICKGVDTRGIGGYVVAPGSVINDREYVLNNKLRIADAPKWLPEKLVYTKKDLPVISDAPEIEESTRNATFASLAGSMRSRGFGYAAIVAALREVNNNQTENPLPDYEVDNIAKSISRYRPEVAETASDFLEHTKVTALCASAIRIENIPKREWVMYGRYVVNNVSVLISPGGVGKSTLTILDAISVVTGKELSGYPVPNKANVLLYGTEDPQDELARKVIATVDFHGIPLSELDGLFIKSGRDDPLVLARGTAKGGVAVNKKAIEDLSAFIKDNNIKLFIADPFVRTHEVSENDNMAIDKVIWAFQRIAEKTQCAICLVHHARKPQGYGVVNGDQNQARGASSLINAARVSHTLAPMTEKEAIELDIESNRRKWYVRLDSAKANLSAPDQKTNWYEKVTVNIPNGDNVGTLTRANFMPEKDQKLQAETSREIEDMQAILNECMEPGDIISLPDAVELVLSRPEYPRLFNKEYTSRRSISRWFATIFGTGFSTECKKFEHTISPKNRSKRNISCIGL